MVAHVESDPDKDTIQQPIHSIHKDEIGVRIPGAPPIYRHDLKWFSDRFYIAA